MKFDDSALKLSDGVVTDFGSHGRCHGCAKKKFSAPRETARINNKFYCRDCSRKKFPGNILAQFELSDARFKCPAEECGANQLSFDEFCVGTCCKDASLWTQDDLKFEILGIINTIYKESRKDENDAEIDFETAEKKVETIRKTLESAEKKAKDARDALNDKKKWRKTVQKRAFFFAKEAMTEDNSDIENDEEPRDEKADEPDERENDDNSCKVCFGKYDKNECLRAAVIPCGHQSCFKCLSSLSEKNCPSCRAEFTDEKLMKLY